MNIALAIILGLIGGLLASYPFQRAAERRSHKQADLPAKKPKAKMRNRTKFTIAAIINIEWYVIACLILSWFDKSVPSELTVGWYAAWTAELGFLFGIRMQSGE